MRRQRTIASLTMLVLLAACAPAGGSSGESTAPRRRTNVIVPEEWQGQNLTTAFDAVQRLRPSWLQPRGGTGLPAVFRNSTEWGSDPRALDGILLSEVSEMRFLSGPDATTRFGSGYPGGIIQVIAN
jgi:hypothetical protein